MAKSAERPCVDLVTLASFERQIGFERVADAYLEMASGCDGCNCRSPFHCGTAAAAQAKSAASARVLAFKARRSSYPRSAEPTVSTGGDNLVPMTLERERVEDSSGNWMERVNRPVSALRPERIHGSVELLFEYWHSLWVISHGTLGDIDPIRFGQLGWLGRLHLVDVSHPDPRQFHFQIRGARIPAVSGASREGAPLGNHPLPIVADIVTRDYNRVRRDQEPLYSHLRGSLAGAEYRYDRLILPLSTSGKRVDRLLVAIKMQELGGATA